MINRVVLCGRPTKDIELRYSPSGTAVAKFILAVNRTFKDASGEQKADFINCTVFKKQAENTANYVKKGNLIAVEGRIQTGSYEKDGVRTYTTEVICDSVQFLEPRGAGEGSSNQGNTNYQPTQQNANTVQYGGNNQQQNYTRVDEDPFAPGAPSNNQNPEDDLPF